MFILILLGLPRSDFPDISFLNIPNLDKVVHAGLFFVFIFLLCRGFAMQQKFSFLKKTPLLSSFVIGIFYGGLTEILQATVFIERTGDFFDFLADTAGCFAGLIFFVFLKKKIIPAN